MTLSTLVSVLWTSRFSIVFRRTIVTLMAGAARNSSIRASRTVAGVEKLSIRKI